MFFFSSRRRHTRCSRDWSSDVCSSDLHPESRGPAVAVELAVAEGAGPVHQPPVASRTPQVLRLAACNGLGVETIRAQRRDRSEEHTSELQSRLHLVCRLLLEKKTRTMRRDDARSR